MTAATRDRLAIFAAGAASAVALRVLYDVAASRWRSVPYAWQQTASVGDVLRCALLGPRSLYGGKKAAVYADRRRVACPAQSVSYGNTDPLLLVAGSGSRLEDEAGRSFLDSRNNVAHVGHANARVAAAVGAQAAALNTNTRYLHPNHAALAGRLLATMPAPLRDGVVFFVNSGSEANDLALRLARARVRKLRGVDATCGVVVLERAYHGHTAAVLGLSPYKYGHASFGPPPGARPPHVAEASAPDAYRGPGLEAAVKSAEAACDDLEARGAAVGAFFVESGMSVAGVVVAPPTYMARVYAAVRSRGGVCVADEVQTGLGRLGERFWWAFEEHGVVPDAVTVGKPFGNGFPLAAVVASRELSDAFAAGPEYFNTFGGSPAACAAGLAVMDELERGGLRANADASGDALRAGLEALRARGATLAPPAAGAPRAVVGDVRGAAGLFLGVDLVRCPASREPATREASLVCSRMVAEHRVLSSLDGPHDNVIVVKPPLAFSVTDAAAFLSALEESLAFVNALPPGTAFTHTPT